MTALKEYARLESMGVWQETPDAQRRDVAVRFGDSTLIITDKNDRPLTHWSLAAVMRVNPGGTPATFSPGENDPETLEVDEPMMVEAIEKVRTLISRRRPQPGRLRIWLLIASVLAVLALAIFWMPGALRRHTVSVLPDATRDQIGTDLLTAITRVSGQPCFTPRGSAALSALSERLLGNDGEILIVPDAVNGVVHLPGGIYLVNRSVVEDHETPDVVAGYVLAEMLRREARDPMEHLLDEAGLIATFRLLTTGAVKEETLSDYAETLLAADPDPVSNTALIQRFVQARVPSTPYAYALDVTGEATLPLIEADPMRGGGAERVLSDADWISLQAICLE